MLPRFKQPRQVASRAEWDELKRQAYDRDKWECRLCGSRVRLTPDHIVKRSQGGDDCLENLWTLCVDCHRRKDEYQLTPEEFARIPKGMSYGKPCYFHRRSR